MSRILNQRIFSKKANDDSAITEVTVVRVSNGDIGLLLKASDADSNKKVFDAFKALGIDARHGQNQITQDHLCLFDTQNIVIIATALVRLKDKQLLSHEFFADICANFPGDIEHRIDRRVADIAGIELSQAEEEKGLAVDMKRSNIEKYLGDIQPNLAELVMLQRGQIVSSPENKTTVVSKPQQINYASGVDLGRQAQNRALLATLKELPEFSGLDLTCITSLEFEQEFNRQLAITEAQRNSK